jgi:hypothetical protein
MGRLVQIDIGEPAMFRPPNEAFAVERKKATPAEKQH